MVSLVTPLPLVYLLATATATALVDSFTLLDNSGTRDVTVACGLCCRLNRALIKQLH